MDRQTDLTIEALAAREVDPESGLDHFTADRNPRCGFSIIGITRLSELMSSILGGMMVIDAPPETEHDFETFRSWMSSFGYPHPVHVDIDPYSFMWGNEIDCDRCGCAIHALNRPEPCFGICSRCHVEMYEEPKEATQ